MIAVLRHIGLVARLTFLEAVRQRFFNFIMLMSLGLLGCVTYFRLLSFQTEEMRFDAEFGMGAIVFFGSILSVVASAQLFFAEIENRTALTLLAKPVRRWSFIAGKLLGVSLLLLVFVGILTALLGTYLWWRQGNYIDAWLIAEAKLKVTTEFPEEMRVQFDGFVLDAFLQWLKFSVVAAFTMFIASFSNTNLYTVIVSFFIYLICLLQYIALDAWKGVSSPVLRGLVWLLSKVFPNLQLFAVGDLLLFTQKSPIPNSAVAAAIGYAIFYVVLFTALAVASFSSREI